MRNTTPNRKVQKSLRLYRDRTQQDASHNVFGWLKDIDPYVSRTDHPDEGEDEVVSNLPKPPKLRKAE